MSKLIDMTGKKIGRLTVLNRSETQRTSKKAYWICQCECGNIVEVCGVNLRNGKTQSCGCLQKERTGQISKKDLTGKRFGRWTVLFENGRNPNQNVLWHCRCDCGTERDIVASQLLQGKTLSCGCRLKEINTQRCLQDLTGQRFGKLKVIKICEEKSAQGRVQWVCQCDCGSITIATADALKTGKKKSCGCLKSSGEEKIGKILTENNIPFRKEKIFSNCRGINQGLVRFDFFVNNTYIIEYDGEQHFSYSGTGWDTEEHFITTQQNDKIKNRYCLENNIPLIRIPYTHLSELCLEDLLLNTSNFIVNKKDEE